MTAENKASPRNTHHPLVSVLVPARNEQADIARCVESLLQQGNGVEIVVADDNSTDETAAIVRGLAARWPNVKLLSVPPLPSGWLGKNHALHLAVAHVSGDWLLFTDADTVHLPGGLPGIVEQAERDSVDLLSLSPQQETRTWWERAVIPVVYDLLARLYPFHRVNDPRDPLAAANGQYLLIRAAVYRALGGHAAIRSELLEDVALALRAKRAGYRIRFSPGAGVVTTRMYERFAEMWQGWTKNLFLLYGRDSRAVFAAAAGLALRYWLPALGGAALVCFGFPAAWAGRGLLGFAVLQHILVAGGSGRNRADGVSVAVWLVPGSLLVFLLLLNSQRRYSRNLGVDWKGRRYPTSAYSSGSPPETAAGPGVPEVPQPAADAALIPGTNKQEAGTGT